MVARNFYSSSEDKGWTTLKCLQMASTELEKEQNVAPITPVSNSFDTLEETDSRDI